MSLSGDISLIWDDTDEFQLDGMQKSFEKSGKAEVAGSTVSVCSIFAESESAYYMVMVMGNLKTIESVRKVLSIQEMNTAVTINISTRDFISALSAVPDKINGVNSLDNVKTLFEYAEVDSRLQKNVTQIRKIAREALEGGWGVIERQSLYDMKSWMMEKGLNMDVLSELEDLGVNEDTGRGQLEQIMDTKGLSEQDKIRVMAVYDAKAAFGEAAVKAWDLSQIPGVFTRAYAAGYCTYEEALDSSLEAARLAQQSYDSWLSYYQSYLYGYSYWVGESLDDPAGSAYQRKAVMETLLEEKNGISSIDWNMNLAQEW